MGRAADTAVVLEDSKVSRHHARIEWVDAQPHLIDLGSANGSAVNDAAITPHVQHPVQYGDRIVIGDFQLVLHEPEAGQSDRAGASGQPLPDERPAVLTRIEPAELSLVVTTPQWTREFPIRGKTVNIGRDPANDIRIDHPVVSRHHARLEQVAHGYKIIDLDSANGLAWQQVPVSQMLLARRG
jgi:pSer/pThr/pTyr-binding forkhead associated (FHA) protein